MPRLLVGIQRVKGNLSLHTPCKYRIHLDLLHKAIQHKDPRHQKPQLFHHYG